MVKETPITENFFDLFFPKDNNVSYKDVRITDVGLYSITDYKTANAISELIKDRVGNNITITDATANVGGNTISFAKYFNKVNSVELENLHCDILKHNLKAYELENKVNIFCDDYLKTYPSLTQDVIFIDAPWGGVNYKKKEVVDLYLGDYVLGKLVTKIASSTKYIVLKVPKNFNFNRFNHNIIEIIEDYEVIIYKKPPYKHFKTSVKFLLIIIKIKS
ncbi:MAG: hypothetical protein CMF62_00640 [Magnetococcales bacterium]|nr:hypothetical protein [Magnetococcales bacterium]|tara:strand:- start:20443 stop:21099 length:657 start_codon:yes stop_codon:yes gene_type:complete